MAAPQTARSGHAIRAGGLAAALLTAKALAVYGRGVTPGLADIPALLWQDALVALLFWLADSGLRRPRWMWIPYSAIAAYIVINAGVVHALGSPLTIAMLGAAGAALGDSIGSSITLGAIGAMGAVAAAAIAGPLISRALPMIARRSALVVGVLIALAGFAWPSALDTGGLGRNALSSLAAGFRTRVLPEESGRDFRASPFGGADGPSLADLRGVAAGRNVLVIGLESTAAQYLAVYGAPNDPTPAVTALARESLIFDAAYAAYPESVKGLFAVLCGASPAIDVSAEDLAASPCDSVVRRVAAARYRTALFHSGRFAYLGMQPVMDVHRFDTTVDAGTISGKVQSSFGVDEPSVVARILTWIDEGPADRPFFALYLPAAGHHPYLSEGGPFPDTTLGAWQNAALEGDRALGTLIDGLKRRGLYDNTLIVVFGDHGEAFGQHPGNWAHSLYIYDENVRVPLIVRVPGATAPTRRVAGLASVIDIGPTIVDLLGLPGEPTQEGVSLLRGKARMSLFHADYATGWLGLRDLCWKYLYEIDAKRSELYDVCADPGETRNVSDAHADRARTYRDHVQAWAAARRAAVIRK